MICIQFPKFLSPRVFIYAQSHYLGTEYKFAPKGCPLDSMLNRSTVHLSPLTFHR